MKHNFVVFLAIILASLSGETAAMSGITGCSPPGAGKAGVPVLLVERDVPQTRTEFVPIINHEALIANLSEETIEVDIESPIPPGLYVVKEFFPAFGRDSLLAAPMYYPQKIKISEYNVLERPTVEKKNEVVAFRWSKVSIPAKHAAIAQYDNYFGDLSQYYTKEGLSVLELSIRTAYTSSLREKDGALEFDLKYVLENKGKEDIENISMDLILPDTIHAMDEKPEVKLFEVTEATASPEIKADRGMLGDGFGNPATGTIFAINLERLKPGEPKELWMKVKGKKVAEKGEIYPLVTIQCLMKGDRIWPPTKVQSKKELQMTKFYYQQCNLIVPDGKLFRIEPDKINVIQVKGL